MRLAMGAVLVGLVACGGDDAASSVSGNDAGGGSHADGASSAPDAAAGVDGGSPSVDAAGDDAPSSSGDDGGRTDATVPAVACKRGIATNTAPSIGFARTATSPGIAWWYDWSNNPSAAAAGGIDFVPMIWGANDVGGPIPSGSKYLLGFNEPNFKAQSNMTPEEAAQKWPAVEALAQAQGIPIVAPAVNFCGSAQDPSGCADPSVTDPYTFLKDFFAACSGCQVDAIAVHWYNCDVPSLQAYIDGNSNLEGFLQFNKPIWLTEFSCGTSASVADQKAYMQGAVAYLEANPRVARYSWFSAGPIPNALLMDGNGNPTDLGKTYAALPQNCK
jgi:hypothetical protein